MGEKITSFDVFRKEYQTCVTYGDLDRLVKILSKDETDQLIEAMKLVNVTTGLDMRQEAVLNTLETHKKYHG